MEARVEVTVNLGFVSVKFKPDFSDAEKESWVRLLLQLEDYRVLSSALNAEYVADVYAAVVRLRDVALPTALEGLPPDAGLQISYSRLRKALRNFLVSVRPIGRDILTNGDVSLADVKPIGHQWTMVAALQSLRDEFHKEIQDNCTLFGLKMPDVFTASYQVPEEIAEEWALEVAPKG